MKRITAITAIAAAGLILVGCGSTTTQAVPAAAPVETQTVTEEVEVTPQACTDALDASEELNRLTGEALDSAARAMEAQMYLDAVAIDEETAYLQELQPQVEQARSDYDAAAIECRGSDGL